MELVISSNIRQKLASKHGVSEEEIIQCFANKDGKDLLDEREEHYTDPPTRWFVAETDFGRVLKVMYIFDTEIGVIIKSCYEAPETIQQIYRRHAY